MSMEDKQDSIRFVPRSSVPRSTEDNLALTPDRMSDECTVDLLVELDQGDYNLTDWDVEFIGSNLGKNSFSVKQKKVVYDLARKFKLL